MSPGNSVEFAHVAFRLVPEVLDPIDMVLLVCKQFRVIDPKVVKVRDIQHIVAAPTIRIDDAVRNDLAFHDGQQRGR